MWLATENSPYYWKYYWRDSALLSVISPPIDVGVSRVRIYDWLILLGVARDETWTPIGRSLEEFT